MPSSLIHLYYTSSLVTDQRTYYQECLSAKRGPFLLNVTFENIQDSVCAPSNTAAPLCFLGVFLCRIMQSSRQPRLNKSHRVVATGCAKEVSLRMEFYFLTGNPPS